MKPLTDLIAKRIDAYADAMEDIKNALTEMARYASDHSDDADPADLIAHIVDVADTLAGYADKDAQALRALARTAQDRANIDDILAR